MGAELAIALVWPANARADAEPVRIEYRAHARCPGREEFVAELFSRTARARLALPSEKARTFRASITEVTSGSSGRLEIIDLTGGSSARVLEGETCAEVMSALALTAALAIDPEASLEPTPKARRAPKAGTLPASGAESTPAGSAPVLPKPKQPRAVGPPTSTAASDPGDGHWTRAVGGGFFATSLIAPELAPGAELFFDLQDQDAPAAPSVRAILRYARSGEVETNAGDGKFQWAVARAEICLPELVVGRSLVACPGLGFEGGALQAAGSATLAPRQRARPWLAASALARAGIRIGAGISLEFRAELAVPFVRDRFIFNDPATVVHAVPAAGAVAGVGVRFRLP